MYSNITTNTDGEDVQLKSDRGTSPCHFRIITSICYINFLFADPLLSNGDDDDLPLDLDF